LINPIVKVGKIISSQPAAIALERDRQNIAYPIEDRLRDPAISGSLLFVQEARRQPDFTLLTHRIPR